MLLEHASIIRPMGRGWGFLGVWVIRGREIDIEKRDNLKKMKHKFPLAHLCIYTEIFEYMLGKTTL